jgi:hypothetical protein
MAWWPHKRVPQSARDVAAALLAGRPLKRTNCSTDGIQYFLEGTVVARFYTPLAIAKETENALFGLPPPDWGPFGFSFSGWPSDMTARHLSALGIKAEIASYIGAHRRKEYVPLMNGRAVSTHGFYTLEQLETLPLWECPSPPARSSPTPFVNLTIPLPF